MRRVMGMLITLGVLLCAAAPAQAISSATARKAVRKAVKTRYDAPSAIAVRCRRASCNVAFRQALSTCKDAHVHVTRTRRVHGLSPRCTDDPAPEGNVTPPPAPDTPGTGSPPGAPGMGSPPPTNGPPPPPGGPPPPPSASLGALAHASDAGYVWWGWTDPYQWNAYPGYWFAEAVWHDQRSCEVYYADYHGVYFWNGSQYQFWYGFWKNWWFGDVYMTDPCSG
jgi:hypothetical protein